MDDDDDSENGTTTDWPDVFTPIFVVGFVGELLSVMVDVGPSVLLQVHTSPLFHHIARSIFRTSITSIPRCQQLPKHVLILLHMNICPQ